MKVQIDWLCQFFLLYICASLEHIWLHCSDDIVTLFGNPFMNFSITARSMNYFFSVNYVKYFEFAILFYSTFFFFFLFAVNKII